MILETALWIILAICLSIYTIVSLLHSPFLQRKLIFKFPPPYDHDRLAELSPQWRRITAVTEEGLQVGFYLPPRRTEQVPKRLCLCWSGNSGRALSWASMAEGCEDDGLAFLLIDFPGYGFSEGTPSPWAIKRGSAAVYTELCRQLGETPGDLARRTTSLGHSMGCAVALALANRFGYTQVLLVSPFSSLRATAAERYPIVPSKWLRYEFDNVREVSQLAVKKEPTRITLWHAVDDDIIPFWMALELTEAGYPRVELRASLIGGHKDLLDDVKPEIVELLRERL